MFYELFGGVSIFFSRRISCVITPPIKCYTVLLTYKGKKQADRIYTKHTFNVACKLLNVNHISLKYSAGTETKNKL